MRTMTAKKKRTWKEHLKAVRTKYGLTQVQFAQRIGIATRTLIAWENEQRVPGRLAIMLLKQAYPDDF